MTAASLSWQRDNGQILSGDHQEAICEIELELKSGAVASVLRLGAALAERHPLEN